MGKVTNEFAAKLADLDSRRGGVGLMAHRCDRSVGPQVTDERCESCGGVIFATGECRCSE